MLTLFVVLATMFSCKLPENENADEPEIYDPKQQYEMTFEEQGYSYRMSLDGDGGVVLYKSAESEATFENLGCNLGNFLTFTDPQNENFISIYLYKNNNAVQTDKITGQPPSGYTTYESLEFTDVFYYSYTEKLDGAQAQCKMTLSFVPYGRRDVRLNIKKEILLDEYEYGVGTYTITDNNKLKVKMDLDSLPEGLFLSNEIRSNIQPSNNITATPELYVNAKEKTQLATGGVKINLQNQQKIKPNKPIYIQLYDDATFKFLIAQTSVSSTITFNGDFKGKSFSNNCIRYLNGARYTFKQNISFADNEAKYVTYFIDNITYERNYLIQKNEEGKLYLNEIFYDGETYSKFIGSHPEYNTSNNFSFANNNKIYICYNEQYYDFDISELRMEMYNDYVYVILEKEYDKFYIFLYEDGTWEWDKGRIRVQSSEIL